MRRRIGTILIVTGALALAYGAAVYFWRDPITDLYARYKQHQLASELERRVAEYRTGAGLPELPADTEAASASNSTLAPISPSGIIDPSNEIVDRPTGAEQLEATRASAEAFLATLEEGDPIGRLIIPKLDIDPVFVNGTRWGADLSRGPGRFPETSLPGLGHLTAIAGHRTTFGAPFRHIDRLKAGDPIRVELPYGTFHYQVIGHEIVDDEDWSIIESRRFETLVLSACHPLYSASQRWIVYARLTKVDLPDGASISILVGSSADPVALGTP